MTEMTSATDLAYDAVLEGILAGTHAMGSRLREEELAAALGVSRTPVREALRRLHSEGLVELLPRRGALVARWDEEDLDEIFELRALLEGYGARRAARRIEAEKLDPLDELCDAMDAAATEGSDAAIATITELNLRFHREIHAAARNPRLVKALGSLVQVPLVHHTFHHYTPEELRRSLGHHRELVAAIRAGDADWAEEVMRAHVHAARASLRRASAQPPAAQPPADEPAADQPTNGDPT
jgi:DNA-binding GntR family transcriptional regulator